MYLFVWYYQIRGPETEMLLSTVLCTHWLIQMLHEEKKHIEICWMAKTNIIMCKAVRRGMRQNERDKLNDISKDRQETRVTAGN